MVILCKVTSRERPYKLRETVNKYLELANNTKDMVWLFTFDKDDYDLNGLHYNELISLTGGILDIRPERTNKIAAINSGVNELNVHWDILLNISDDQHPIVKGYDDKIRQYASSDLDCSLWFYDGWQNRINTQEILGKTYYQRFNHIYDPRFKSFFCDNYSTDLAKKSGKMVYIKDCIIKHFHPGWSPALRGQTDNLYKSNDKYWNEDQHTYNLLK